MIVVIWAVSILRSFKCSLKMRPNCWRTWKVQSLNSKTTRLQQMTHGNRTNLNKLCTFEHPAARQMNQPKPPSGATKSLPSCEWFLRFFLAFFAGLFSSILSGVAVDRHKTTWDQFKLADKTTYFHKSKIYYFTVQQTKQNWRKTLFSLTNDSR